VVVVVVEVMVVVAVVMVVGDCFLENKMAAVAVVHVVVKVEVVVTVVVVVDQVVVGDCRLCRCGPGIRSGDGSLKQHAHGDDGSLKPGEISGEIHAGCKCCHTTVCQKKKV
jgi:hypothetical protein